jgi:ADP-ribosyl-[dinitrogen reductase] hydrolase
MSAPTAALPQLPLRHCYWVVPGLLLAGEHPGGPTRDKTKDRLKKLLAAGIECFVDLTKPTELLRYDAHLPFYVEYTRKAIKDHGLPGSREQMVEILDYVGNAMRAGRPVYVHCRAGIGRTGTVIGCLLVERGLSGDGALDELNRLWQQSKRSKSWAFVPETDAQANYVREWKPSLQNSGFAMSAIASAVSGMGPISAGGDHPRSGVLAVADVQSRAARHVTGAGQARAAVQNLAAGKGRAESKTSGAKYGAGAGLAAAAAQARAAAERGEGATQSAGAGFANGAGLSAAASRARAAAGQDKAAHKARVADKGAAAGHNGASTGATAVAVRTGGTPISRADRATLPGSGAAAAAADRPGSPVQRGSAGNPGSVAGSGPGAVTGSGAAAAPAVPGSAVPRGSAANPGSVAVPGSGAAIDAAVMPGLTVMESPQGEWLSAVEPPTGVVAPTSEVAPVFGAPADSAAGVMPPPADTSMPAGTPAFAFVRAPGERSDADPLLDTATLVAARALRERFVGTLFGLAVGDAVAAATQFRRPGSFSPVGDMIGGGPFDLPRGGWSDDTAMALCLAESLLECNGFDPRDQVQRYARWQQEGYLSCTGQCVGITANTARSIALAKWRRVVFPGSFDPEQLDPEPLSRIAPIALYYLASLETTLQQAAESSRTTCQAPAVLDACRELGRALNAALAGQPKARILADVNSITEAAAHTNNTASAALAAAFWAFSSTDNFRDAVLRAANVGGNSDVVASVCGQLAGAHYGVSAIPPSWRNGLMQKDLIEGYADRLLAHGLVSLSS